MEQGRLYICAKDIMVIEDVSYKTARKNLQIIKDRLGKTKGDKLSIKRYCEVNDVDIEDVKDMIFRR